MSWQHSITEQERLDIKGRFARFAQRFEDVFVYDQHNRISRLPMCMHHLLHVADWIEWWGPPILYSQFPMESTIGFLKDRINQDRLYMENLLNQAL
ncbi:hypothetical protein BT69DRAFT_1238294, partial [Atractiella rhizophila]